MIAAAGSSFWPGEGRPPLIYKTTGPDWKPKARRREAFSAVPALSTFLGGIRLPPRGVRVLASARVRSEAARKASHRGHGKVCRAPREEPAEAGGRQGRARSAFGPDGRIPSRAYSEPQEAPLRRGGGHARGDLKGGGAGDAGAGAGGRGRVRRHARPWAALADRAALLSLTRERSGPGNTSQRRRAFSWGSANPNPRSEPCWEKQRGSPSVSEGDRQVPGLPPTPKSGMLRSLVEYGVGFAWSYARPPAYCE
ncbi:uncharacterized protein LOC141582178 [Saimiri boliviensis]|uniref:uncharacterized protein LOC141582178 n=1 Tax=Saimiri boliviensis TaxID=27679 RepID=UPI003D78438B